MLPYQKKLLKQKIYAQDVLLKKTVWKTHSELKKPQLVPIAKALPEA